MRSRAGLPKIHFGWRPNGSAPRRSTALTARLRPSSSARSRSPGKRPCHRPKPPSMTCTPTRCRGYRRKGGLMRRLRYLEAIAEGVRAEMAEDDRVLIMGEDVRQSLRGVTKGLLDQFGPDRVLDTPISEAAFTGFATGAAMAGYRPIVEYQISALLYVAFDQLVDQAQKIRFMTGGQVTIPRTSILPRPGPLPSL